MNNNFLDIVIRFSNRLIKIEFFLFSKLPIPKPRKIAKTTTGRREPCDNDLNIFAGMIPSKKSFKLVLLVRPFNDVFICMG